MYDFKERLASACGNEQTGRFHEAIFFFPPPPRSCCLASQRGASGVALLEEDNMVCGQGNGTALAPASLGDALPPHPAHSSECSLSNPPNSFFEGPYGHLGTF